MYPLHLIKFIYEYLFSNRHNFHDNRLRCQIPCRTSFLHALSSCPILSRIISQSRNILFQPLQGFIRGICWHCASLHFIYTCIYDCSDNIRYGASNHTKRMHCSARFPCTRFREQKHRLTLSIALWYFNACINAYVEIQQRNYILDRVFCLRKRKRKRVHGKRALVCETGRNNSRKRNMYWGMYNRPS